VAGGRLEAVHRFTQGRRERRGQVGCWSWFALCPANANGVETPSPGLAEERGQPWVCSQRGNQPHRGCGHHRVSKEKAISGQARRGRQGTAMRFARRAQCLGVRKVWIPKILTPRREGAQEPWSCFTQRRLERRGEPLFIRRVSRGSRSPRSCTTSPHWRGRADAESGEGSGEGAAGGGCCGPACTARLAGVRVDGGIHPRPFLAGDA
jgi:hypothetical protein